MNKIIKLFLLVFIIIVIFNINVFAKITVNLRVEGLTDTIMQGRVKAETVGKAIQTLGSENNIEVIMKNNSNNQELYSIAGIKNNTYSPRDKWRSYIVRNGNIIQVDDIPNTNLVSEDELVVYYGDESTKIVTDIKKSYTNEKLTMEFLASVVTWIENNGIWEAITNIEKLEDITVILYTGDGKIKTKKTNSDGLVSFDLKSPNIYTYKVSGEKENGVPLIVRLSPVKETLGLEETKELTRAEVTALLVNYYGITTKKQVQNFDDVTKDTPYKEQIDIAISSEIISGNGEGEFNPNNPVTMQELVIILNNIFKDKPLTNKDIDLKLLEGSSNWAKPYIIDAMNKGLINVQHYNWTSPITLEILKSIL